MMELVFFPVNMLFTTAPLLGVAVLVVLFLSLVFYTTETAIVINAVVAEADDKYLTIGYAIREAKLKRRFITNVLFILLVFWVAGGSVSSVTPKMKIVTSTAVNDQYISELVTQEFELQTPVDRGTSWGDLTDNKESERSQEERIKKALDGKD